MDQNPNDIKKLQEELNKLKQENAQLQAGVSPQIQPESQPKVPTPQISQEAFLEQEQKETLDPTQYIKKTKEIKPKKSKAELALSVLNEIYEIESLEIFLPALKKNVVVTPLKSEEEILLKTTRFSYPTYMNHINKLILKHTIIDDIPASEYFETLDNFLNTIIPIDRSLLIFGLIKNSFEKLTEYPITCQGCGKEFIAEGSVETLDFRFEEDVVNFDYYNYSITKSFLNNTMDITFGFNPEIIRLELSKYEGDVDEKDLNVNTMLSALNSIIYFIKEVKVYKKTAKRRSLVTQFNINPNVKGFGDFKDLYIFFKEMPMKLKEKFISEIDLSEMDKYAPIFETTEVCPYCGYQHTFTISPEIEFFRKALSLIG